MISNEQIIDAYLCLLDKHHRAGTQRELRVLRPTDFDRIRRIKRAFDALWRVEKNLHGPNLPYYLFRKRTLDLWQVEYCWTYQTRNLYASMMTKITKWNRGQLSQLDHERLERMRPGALPLLHYLLPEHTTDLFEPTH